MLKLICVLRSSDLYGVDYVEHLRDCCEKYLQPHEFICLSDVPVPCKRIPLLHAWPGWWAKLEMFRITGPCLYLDLDTVIRGPVPELDIPCFGMLKDFLKPVKASGVMAWSGDMSILYERFKADPRQREDYRVFPYYGDGGFIQKNWYEEEVYKTKVSFTDESGVTYDHGRTVSSEFADKYRTMVQRVAPECTVLQDLWPGVIRSRKWSKGVDAGEPIICYSGPPRPRETGWAH